MPNGRIEVITGGMFCHRKGQLILMSDGSCRPIDEIGVGDRVVSDLGSPVRVLALHRGVGSMAKISPSRGGDPFVVTLDHELTLVDTPSKQNGKPCERGGRVVDVSVRDWLVWSNKRKGIFKLFQVGVPVFESPGVRDNDLDPYFLGVMLGDGSFDTRIGLVSMDPEILLEAEAQAERYGLRVAEDAPKGQARAIRLVGSRGKPNPIADRFRALGLYGLTGSDKFIPQKYLSASREDRLELLAGLLDTDGSASSYGAGFDFINKSKHLSDGVAFLARSLGMSATVSVALKKAQTGPKRSYHRVYIGGEVSQVPTRLPRKQLSRIVRHRPTVTRFDVTHLREPEAYFGITVEGGRYLLGDFTVTHNSGKSEELVRRLRRAVIAKKSVIVFKHDSDDRFDAAKIGCHNGLKYDATPVPSSDDVRLRARGHEVVGIDEIQFFNSGIVEVCEELANVGVRVIVAGLDLDSMAVPFGPMPHLMAIAEVVTKLHAVCMVCGEPACRTQHKAGKTEQVEVGADAYEARCRKCWTPT